MSHPVFIEAQLLLIFAQVPNGSKLCAFWCLEVCSRLMNGEFVLIHCFESSWNWEIR